MLLPYPSTLPRRCARGIPWFAPPSRCRLLRHKSPCRTDCRYPRRYCRGVPASFLPLVGNMKYLLGNRRLFCRSDRCCRLYGTHRLGHSAVRNNQRVVHAERAVCRKVVICDNIVFIRTEPLCERCHRIALLYRVCFNPSIGKISAVVPSLI